MIKTIKEYNKLYLFFFAILLIISVSPLISGFLSVFAFILVVISFFVLSESDSIVLLFGVMPFANIFKVEAGETSLFTVCEMLLIIYLIYRKKSINIFYALLLGVLTVYMIIFSANDLNALLIVKVMLGFIIIWFSTLHFKKCDVKNLSYILAISTILMLLLTNNASYFSSIEAYFKDLNYYVDAETGRAIDVIRNGGFLGDPNYCAVLIVVSVALLGVLYYYRDIGNEFWLLSVFLVPLGFMTYSKSYFLCISLLMVFLTVFVLIPKYRGWALLAIAAGIVIVILALSGRIETFNMIFDRFVSGNLASGRDTLNETYIDYILGDIKVFMFGEGICIDRIDEKINNVHNIYIQLFYNMGIVGCLIYLTTMYMSLTVSSSLQKADDYRRKVVDYIPTVFLCIMFGFLAGITNYEFPFYIIIAYLSLNYNRLKTA